MKPSEILALMLVGGGVFAFVMPAPGVPGEEAQAEAPADQRILKVAVSEPEQSAWAHGTTLPRQRDGHFYADIEIDGRVLPMLVDTGASTVALTAEDADAIGIDWISREPNAVVMTANGPAPALQTKIEMMRLGELEAREVTAMVIPRGLDISLLGQSFLAKIDKVEIAGDDMILTNE